MSDGLLRVACVQMCSGDDREHNLATAERLIDEAAAEAVRLIVLPENFSFMGRNDEARRAAADYPEDSWVLGFLSEQAERHRMHVIGGSLLLRQRDSDRLRNASPVFSPDGKLLEIYDKMHLFDVDLGPERYMESATISPGSEPKSVSIGPWRIGLSVCYDLRFPELYRRYAEAGCQVLTVPSAFTVPTGMAHWETLLRARAIENQAYVLAPGQTGEHPGGRRTWGHSMIVDPWGEVLACREDGEGLVLAELDLARVDQVRSMIPALRHRRL
ncbi:MAG TPA: carbon-nitrogen hydrolase family protein [Mariprofundaceae bacterium]|nr:carbon-nitrogen hydrolase family protein [Mariprofundaceae bacterium]